MIGKGVGDPGVRRPDRRRRRARPARATSSSCCAGCSRTTPRSQEVEPGRQGVLRRGAPPRGATTSTPSRCARYFDFTKVRAGLLDVTGRLFDVEYVEVDRRHAWHADVASYDVVLAGAAARPDPPRPAPARAASTSTPRSSTSPPGIPGRQLPEGVLVCNFPRGADGAPDVVTLFHEFGHLVHHVLAGRQEWVRFSGVATEWDFVEAPSQMLEEWAWDADVLRTFATDADGEPIPAELVAQMRAADDFGKGCHARTQMFYAAMSYSLHQDAPDDLTARVRELQETLRPVRLRPGHPLPRRRSVTSTATARLLHLHVDPGDREGPVLRLRPRRPVRHRGGAPLPRPGARRRAAAGTPPTWSRTSWPARAPLRSFHRGRFEEPGSSRPRDPSRTRQTTIRSISAELG